MLFLDFNIDFLCFDLNNVKDKQFCMNVVYGCLWKGKYLLVVVNLKVVEIFFNGGNKGW